MVGRAPARERERERESETRERRREISLDKNPRYTFVFGSIKLICYNGLLLIDTLVY